LHREKQELAFVRWDKTGAILAVDLSEDMFAHALEAFIERRPAGVDEARGELGVVDGDAVVGERLTCEIEHGGAGGDGGAKALDVVQKARRAPRAPLLAGRDEREASRSGRSGRAR